MSGLRFRHLRIRRMLGVTEAFELRDLATGVNVVYGPNASGKTTTARALEALLWPRVADRDTTSIDAHARLGEDSWFIRVDTGFVEYQQNGSPAGSLPTSPIESRDRYRLWLPDLLRTDDVDFAKKILIESSGGFDLEAAAKALERKQLSHRQRQQQLDLRRARERVREARAAQEGLVGERAALAAKAARLDDAPAIDQELNLYRTAAEHARLRSEAERVRRQLEALPPVLKRIRGDEAEQVSNLRERLESTSARLAGADLARARAGREIDRLALDPMLTEGDVLLRLQADAERLTEVDRSISEAEKELAAATVRLGEEGAALRQIPDPGRLAALDLTGLERLREVVEAADAARETRRLIEAELAALPDVPPPSGDVDRLRHGAYLLERWLSAGRDDSGEATYLRALVLSALGVLAFALIALLVAGRYAFAAALVLCGGLLLFGLKRAPRRVDEQPSREREFLMLGLLEAPDLWDAPAVAQCLAKLDARIDQEVRAERNQQRRQELVARLREAERRDLPTDARVQEIAAEFGLAIGTDGPRLLWLVERVSRWQKARVERLACERALVAACGEQRSLLEAANERLAPLGLERVTETRSLRGTLEKLRVDLTTHENARRAHREADDQGAHAREEINRLETEIRRIIDRVGIAAEEEGSLPELCGRAEEYRQLVRSFDIVDGQRLHIEQALRELPGFDEALFATPINVLTTRVGELEREQADIRALGEEVGSLRARIEGAMNGHALEDALTEEARRRHALLDTRSRELRAAVAALLVDYVERETRSEHLPEVFHRANQLFNRITRGAYELRVEVGDSPGFRAYDTRLDRGFGLDELSSGTRVQLLLAVRIAFVECLESGVALPLLMDETLANSDDERAAAIMDAVIQLAADGRQIFYFTAQPDEVAKWKRAVQSRPEVDFACIDLAEVRNLDQRLDFDLVEVTESRPPLPSPTGVDHREYGRRLRIPRIDIHAPPSSLHLWYLVEEPTLLHHILANLHVSRWGELRSMMAAGGPRLLEAIAYGRIEAAAGVAEEAIERIRIGRGRRVDRRALASSGAVSDRFIDEVDALCVRLDGDAQELLAQLEARTVAKFQTRNIETLRDHLERESYLDVREPLNIEIIRRQMIAEHSARAMGGPLTLSEIDRLLARVATGAGFPLQPRKQPPTPQSQLWPDVMM